MHSYKHHMCGTSLYNTWRNIHQKCFNENSTSYKYYGGRGIKVCDEWKSDFLIFHDWAYANGYCEGLTIDRIDNNGDYCPDNCRWVPMSVQANNKRTTRFLTFNGVTKPIREWRSEFGLGRGVIEGRLLMGWSVDEALTTPASLHNKRHRRS